MIHIRTDPNELFFLQAQNKLKSIANYTVLGFWGKLEQTSSASRLCDKMFNTD